MQSVLSRVRVSPDGKGTVELPPDVPPGEWDVVVLYEGQPARRSVTRDMLPVLDAPHWPRDLVVRRGELYDDGPT
jgi:hypothetical protein